MKTTSRASSISSSLSRETALDMPRQHNDSSCRADSIKDPLSELKDAADGAAVQISSLIPDTDMQSNSKSESESVGEQTATEKSPLPNDEEFQTGGGPVDSNLGRTCTWAELPQWMKDNPAILTGYRRATYSYNKCVRSLWYLHNETVNIWSHLLGAIAFMIVLPVAYFYILEVHNSIGWADIAVLYIFLAGAIICLAMSASFHAFSCHSEKVCAEWIRCDYMGIISLIVSSFYPAVYYGFYCYSTFQIIYICLITGLGAVTIIGVMQPQFRLPQYRWVRSVLFVSLGLSGICPIVHGIVLYGFSMAKQAVALNYIFCMGGAYIFGAVIYGTRTPERFFPGKFDNFMASHQIFHVFVLIGCIIHLLGVIEAMKFWHDPSHSCTIPLDEMRSMFTT